MKTMDFNTYALRAMLSNSSQAETSRKLKAAAALAAAKMGHAVHQACPECGSSGPHDSNGDRLDPQALCGCGHLFNVTGEI